MVAWPHFILSARFLLNEHGRSQRGDRGPLPSKNDFYPQVPPKCLVVTKKISTYLCFSDIIDSPATPRMKNCLRRCSRHCRYSPQIFSASLWWPLRWCCGGLVSDPQFSQVFVAVSVGGIHQDRIRRFRHDRPCARWSTARERMLPSGLHLGNGRQSQRRTA